MIRHARTVLLPLQLVLVLSLLGANMQCLARCVTVPCHPAEMGQNHADESKVPPCHRGSSEKSTPEQQPCKYSVLVADTVRNVDSLHPLLAAHDALSAALPVAMLVPESAGIV